MAGTTGLEPAASAVTGQRSNQLNYVPTRQINELRQTTAFTSTCTTVTFDPSLPSLPQNDSSGGKMEGKRRVKIGDSVTFSPEKIMFCRPLHFEQHCSISVTVCASLPVLP